MLKRLTFPPLDAGMSAFSTFLNSSRSEGVQSASRLVLGLKFVPTAGWRWEADFSWIRASWVTSGEFLRPRML